MSYTVSDAYNDLTQALNLTTPPEWDEDGCEHVSEETDLALAEIARLQRAAARAPVGKARQRGRPVNSDDIRGIEHAVMCLENARDNLRKAGAHNAAGYVRRALKSAQGALNNARAHLARQERSAP